MVKQLDVPTLCAQCQGGRLIGQAVHERDFGWRYFLACADCEAKLELGRESVWQNRQPSIEVLVATVNSGHRDVDASVARPADDVAAPPMKGGAGRKCSLPGCTTILSAYNTTTACWAHTSPSFK
jgi:hypothetical protein